MRQATGFDKAFCDLSNNAHQPEVHRLHGTRVRAIFISDVHLGTSASQADSLLCFLRSCQTDIIYLVGDIVDGWRLLRGQPLPRSHLTVMAELLARARAGVRVVYIPGNHDECLRQFVGLAVGGIEITDSTIHETASGRRYLVLHGDELDRVVQRVPWMARVGNWAYRASLAVSSITLMQGRLGSYYRVAFAPQS